MKRLTSIILVLLLLLSMLTVTTASIGATSKNTPAILSADSTNYEISEYTKENADKVDGEIHGYIGDCDQDTDISIMDATQVQLAVARLITIDDLCTILADVDRDSEVSIMDATEIQLYVARISVSGVIGHILYTKNAPTEPIQPEQNARLTVWAPDAAVNVFKNQCYDFVDKYSDYNIDVRVVAMGEGDAATSLLNDPYYSADVFSFACDQLNSLDDAGVITRVHTKLANDVTARNSEASISAASIDRRLLAYPQTADNGYYLVYDKRYVSDEDAKTLEGILKACRKANKKFIMDAGNGFYGCVFPFTGGLRLEGLEGYYNDVQKFNNYDEDEVVDTLKAFADLFDEYSDIFSVNSPSRISAGFSQYPTTVAAGIDGSWNASTVSSILGKNYGAVKLPTIKVNGENKQLISMHGYKLIGINSSTRYPNASQLLANYLTSEKCQMERAEKIGWGPSNINAANSDTVQSNKAIKALLDQSNYAVPQVNISYTFWEPMGNLGGYISDPYCNHSTYELKYQFNRTIANITDE